MKRVGDRTFPLIERYVDDIVSVNEDEIAPAIHLLLEHEKVLAEGAGAVPLAALLSGKLPVGASDVTAMVLSGGNIAVRDVEIVMKLETRGPDHVREIIDLLRRNGFGVTDDVQ